MRIADVTHYVDLIKAPAPAALKQKRRLAATMRLVIERLVSLDMSAQDLRAATDGLRRYAAGLKQAPRPKGVSGDGKSTRAKNAQAFLDRSPVSGRSNPLAQPLKIFRYSGRSVEASVTFSSAYEGPPGSVHGGFVAAVLDEVLGFADFLQGTVALTGSLTVRYHRPTPLHTALTLEAHVVRQQGRKIFKHASIRVGDVITAEAEGLFIAIDPATIAGLRALKTGRPSRAHVRRERPPREDA